LSIDRVNSMVKRLISLLLLPLVLGACGVNPVTGERELVLVSESSEIQMGEKNYAPMQQAQGGEYDIDPVLTEYVQGVGDRLAAVSDRKLPYEFVVLNNTVPNAWALPGGKIAINRGLLTELGSEAELAAVLGHEIVHAAARHSAQQMERGMLLQGLILATAVATSDSDYGNLAVGGANVAGQLINQRYSREAELEADFYGMQYMSEAGYDPEGAVTLQQTFVRLSEGREQGWLQGLFASHPPSDERVQANVETAAALPPGGELGREDYQAALARTSELLPAYKAYEEGRKALGESKTALAREKADAALGIFSGEGHFHALRGDARLLENDFDGAVENYDRAIERRDDFFYYYLQRGLANQKLGRQDRAQRDLTKSVEYLPTAPAHFALGNIAADRGNRQAAIQHYRTVAGAQGEMAEAAYSSIVRLDIGENPGEYLSKGCSADREGNLVVSVRNDTPVPITDVRFVVEFRDQGGVLRQIARSVGGNLAAGQVVSVRTGLGPYPPGSSCPVAIVGARVAR
jgi:predicted Zn-dependent protease